MHRLVCLFLAAAAALFAWDTNDDLLDAARKGDLDTRAKHLFAIAQ